jgi:hypothetical protein
MPTKLDVTRRGDPRDALLLGEACSLAYLPEPEGPKGFRDQLGLDARLISVENTQAYVAQSPELVLVAFRGSECPSSLDGFKDWLLTNASNYLVLPEGRIGTDFVAAGVGARFHRGFMAALDIIWTPLFAAVDEAIRQAERPIWITGHSLGGALALLAAWRFERNFLTVDQILTFGAPMIGNEAAAAAFEKQFGDRITRYVNFEDPVPLLPSVSLSSNSYVHCPAEVSLRDDPAAVSALDSLKQTAGAAAGAMLQAGILDEVWDAVHGRIAAHMIDRYLDRVKQKIDPAG